MSALTENDLKELKDFINSNFSQVNQRLENIEKEITETKQDIKEIKQEIQEVKIEQGKLTGKFEGIKPAVDQVYNLSEKVGELKNWRQFVFTLITVLASGAVGWFLRK
jgi:predicted nuclease with TOPRIM domain